MKIITLVTGMAAAGAIGVGGTYWTVQSRIEREATQVEAQHAATVAGLRADLARLQAEFAQAKAAAAARDADASLAELRALVRAAQHKLVGSMDKLLQLTDGKLAAGVVSLFALNGTDQSAVEHALTDAQAQLTQLMADNLDTVDRTTPAPPAVAGMVLPMAPGGMTFGLKAYPEAGAKVRGSLVAALRGALGTERFEALMTLMPDRLDNGAGRGFDIAVGRGFGALSRSIRIDLITTPMRDPGKNYRIVDSIRVEMASPPNPLPAGGGTARGYRTSSEVSVVNQAKLAQDYPAFAKLLPADF